MRLDMVKVGLVLAVDVDVWVGGGAGAAGGGQLQSSLIVSQMLQH